MPFSSYIDNALLDHLLGSGAYSKPASLYVALFVGNPLSGGAEVSTSGTAYARLASTFTVTGNAATNASALQWAQATTAWGTIDYCAIYDASTGGNMLVSAVLATPKVMGVGDILRIPASELDVTLT